VAIADAIDLCVILDGLALLSGLFGVVLFGVRRWTGPAGGK